MYKVDDFVNLDELNPLYSSAFYSGWMEIHVSLHVKQSLLYKVEMS